MRKWEGQHQVEERHGLRQANETPCSQITHWLQMADASFSNFGLL